MFTFSLQAIPDYNSNSCLFTTAIMLQDLRTSIITIFLVRIHQSGAELENESRKEVIDSQNCVRRAATVEMASATSLDATSFYIIS